MRSSEIQRASKVLFVQLLFTFSPARTLDFVTFFEQRNTLFAFFLNVRFLPLKVILQTSDDYVKFITLLLFKSTANSIFGNLQFFAEPEFELVCSGFFDVLDLHEYVNDNLKSVSTNTVHEPDV